MASVSASDVSDINDNQDYISVNEDSISSNLAGDKLVLSSDDSDSIAISDEAFDDSMIKSDMESSADLKDGESSGSDDSGSTTPSDSGSENPSSELTTATYIESSTSKVVKGGDFSVTLKDNDGNVLSNKSVIFRIGDTNYTKTTDGNGVAHLTLNKVGTYLILVSFLGDDSYANSSLSKQVTVNKISTSIKNYSKEAVNGKSFSIILKDQYGNPLSSKAVAITFNGKTYKKTTDGKGRASITLSGKVRNTYKITYKFAGDGSYKASSGSISLRLKMRTKIVGSNARILKGSKFAVVLKDSRNKVLANKKITVVYNKKTFTRNTTPKGVIKFTLSPTPGRYYNITYKYGGSSYYGSASKLVTVFIKTPTKLVNSGGFVCKGNVYHVTLKNYNNKVLVNKTVTITYRSKTYKKTTNANGMVGLKISSSPGKAYKFTYKYAGSSYYGASSGSLNLKTKMATQLTGPTTLIKGNPYKATLKDSSGKALSKASIIFNYNGKNYTRTTNSKGIVSLSINPAAGKTYSLSYKFAGNSVYNKSSCKVNLAVKLPTSIKNSGSYAVNDSYYYVTLKDGDSKPLADKAITFTFDGKTYRNTTNSNGVAGLFVLEDKLKTAKLTYKFASDSMYGASSGELNVTVVSDKYLTFNQIVIGAKNLRAYVEKNHKPPETLTIQSIKLNTTTFTYLMSKAIVNLNNGKKYNVGVLNLSSNYSNDGKASLKGNLYKTGYLNLSNYIINYSQTYHKLPNYYNSSLGEISPDLYIFGLSKALDFYSTDKYLPNYLILDTDDVDGIPVPTKRGNASQYKKGLNEVQYLNATQISAYLVSSGNDALNSAIQNLAKQLVSGKSSNWDKANAIFKYVRDNIAYEYYADTKYKATGTLSSKRGNCCDHANLVVALCRAAKIPVRYAHAQGCTFSSGLYTGHVWAQINIDGVWYSADATSKRNELGNIHNWNTNSFNSLKRYNHLPF